MELVVDANILFAAIIKQDRTSDIFFLDTFTYYAPEFILLEFKKYRELIKKKSGCSDKDFNNLTNIFKRRIKLIKENEVIIYKKKAQRISPDPKDVPYLALAMKLKCPVWSNDKKLKNQDNVKIFSTKEIIEKLL